MIISAFTPILLTHTVTLIIAAGKDGAVTVTALLKANSEKEKDHSAQLTGPAGELDDHLVENITAVVKKVAEFKTTIGMNPKT